MDYLTNYYKNLSEDLQRRLNLLENMASTMIANQNNQSNNQADIVPQFLPYPPFIVPHFTNPSTPLPPSSPQPPIYQGPTNPEDHQPPELIPDDSPWLPTTPTIPSPRTPTIPGPGPISPTPRPTPSPQPNPTPSTPTGPDRPDPRGYERGLQDKEYSQDYYQYMRWWLKQPKDWQRNNPPPQKPIR